MQSAINDDPISSARPTTLMVVYCACDCNTEFTTDVRDVGCGAGEIACLECGGDGNWGKFAPEIVGPDFACVDCKGTGRQLVSV